MADQKQDGKRQVAPLGAGGAIAIAAAVSVIPALLVGAGFAQIYNLVSNASPIGVMNVATIGSFMALTAVFYILVQIRDEARVRG